MSNLSIPSRVATIAIRVAPEVKTATRLAALDDSRTLSSWVEKVIRDRLVETSYLPDVKQGRADRRDPASQLSAD